MTAAGLTLFGVLGGDGGAAVIGTADGRQRLVRVGREVAPGIRLTRVEQYAALLSDGTRLALSDVSGRAAPTVQRAVEAVSDVTVLTQERNAEETRAYRLGLAPVEQGGRTAGFAVRPDVDMPMLKKGGIQPGDVITTINGRAFDKSSEVDQLAREVSLSPMLVLEIERGGIAQEIRIDTRNQ